jgi:hypothetical protein
MATPRRNRRRLRALIPCAAEVSETRCLLAASVTLNSPVIEVQGTEADDLVVVQRDRSGVFGGIVLARLSVTVLDANTHETLASGSFQFLPFHDLRSFSQIHISTFGGNDSIINYTDLFDVIDAGRGDDFVVAGNGHSQVFGREGSDRIRGQGGWDTLDGGDGDDLIDGDNGDDLILGGAGVDTLYGGDGNDQVFGDDGHDVIRGNAGGDFLFGGSGNDILYGDDGSDTLEGQSGNDFLYGGPSHDWLFGGSGNDYLDGDFAQSTGSDSLDGGPDIDLAVAARGADQHQSVEKVLSVGGYREDIFAIAAGDLDGDGFDEVYTAVLSDGRSEIFRSVNGAELGQRVWVAPASEQIVRRLAVGDVDGNGTDELYFGVTGHGISRLLRADTAELSEATEIWQSDHWMISALAVGNVDPEPADELFVGLKAESGASALTRSDSGTSLNGTVWSDPAGSWTVQALAAGSVRTDHDGELFIGLGSAGGAASLYRSPRGYGLGRGIWQSSRGWEIASLAVGDPDDTGNGELFVGLDRSNGDAYLSRSRTGRSIGDQVWRGDGSSAERLSLAALAVANLPDSSGAALLSGLRKSSGTAGLFRSETGSEPGSPVWAFGQASVAPTLSWPYLGYGLDLNESETDDLFASTANFGDIVAL